MSIIRLSLLEDGLYAPDLDGAIAYTGLFSPSRGTGRRGLGHIGKFNHLELAKNGHALERYLGRALMLEDTVVGEDGEVAPLVVLVNGFQYDPSRVYFDPPHHPKADNPHCRIYHFEQYDKDIEMRHHSTGWPRGLGIVQDDGGANGLAIGFGWDSDPVPWGRSLSMGSITTPSPTSGPKKPLGTWSRFSTRLSGCDQNVRLTSSAIVLAAEW